MCLASCFLSAYVLATYNSQSQYDFFYLLHKVRTNTYCIGVPALTKQIAMLSLCKAIWAHTVMFDILFRPYFFTHIQESHWLKPSSIKFNRALLFDRMKVRSKQ